MHGGALPHLAAHIPSANPAPNLSCYRDTMLRPTARLLAPVLALAAACQPAADKAPAAAPTTNNDVVPAEAIAAIDTATLMKHIRVLAADSLMGRQPGSAGEDKTVAYLEGQFKAMGLKPGNTDGSYIQKVPLVGITVKDSPTLTFAKGGTTRQLKWRTDYVAWTKHVAPSASLDKSELVFVGYGTEAPEFKWDDYKGMDVAGKTLVMLVNDPPLADTTQFGGNRMTYYGRWTYKYEQGMKHKAAGVLLVHQTERAGYPFAVVQGERLFHEHVLGCVERLLDLFIVPGGRSRQNNRVHRRVSKHISEAVHQFSVGVEGSLTLQ